MKSSPFAALLLIGLLGATLAGCDAAQESAQKVADKAKDTAQELARETLSDTVNALNEQIDQAQKSTSELLGKPQDETAREQPKGETEAPEDLNKAGIET